MKSVHFVQKKIGREGEETGSDFKIRPKNFEINLFPTTFGGG